MRILSWHNLKSIRTCKVHMHALNYTIIIQQSLNTHCNNHACIQAFHPYLIWFTSPFTSFEWKSYVLQTNLKSCQSWLLFVPDEVVWDLTSDEELVCFCKKKTTQNREKQIIAFIESTKKAFFIKKAYYSSANLNSFEWNFHKHVCR